MLWYVHHILEHYIGIRYISLAHLVERNLPVKKFIAMSYYEDDYDEQYEEYCRQFVEEEEVIYVNDGLQMSRD